MPLDTDHAVPVIVCPFDWDEDDPGPSPQASGSSAGSRTAPPVPRDYIIAELLSVARPDRLKAVTEVSARKQAERMGALSRVLRGVCALPAVESSMDPDVKEEVTIKWAQVFNKLIDQLGLRGRLCVSLASDCDAIPPLHTKLTPRDGLELSYSVRLARTHTKQLWASLVRRGVASGDTSSLATLRRELVLQLPQPQHAVDRGDAESVSETLRFIRLHDALHAIVKGPHAADFLSFQFGPGKLVVITSIDWANMTHDRERGVEVSSARLVNLAKHGGSPDALIITALSERKESRTSIEVQLRLVLDAATDDIHVACDASEECWLCSAKVPKRDDGSHTLSVEVFFLADNFAMMTASGAKQHHCVHCGLYTTEKYDVSQASSRPMLTMSDFERYNTKYDLVQKGELLKSDLNKEYPFMSGRCAFVGRLKSTNYCMWDDLHGFMDIGNKLIQLFYSQAARLFKSGHTNAIEELARCFDMSGLFARGRQIRKRFNELSLKKSDSTRRFNFEEATALVDTYLKGNWKAADIILELQDLYGRQGFNDDEIQKRICVSSGKRITKNAATQLVRHELTDALLRGDLLVSDVTGGHRLTLPPESLAKQFQTWVKSKDADSSFTESDLLATTGSKIGLMGWEIRLVMQSAGKFAAVLNQTRMQASKSLAASVESSGSRAQTAKSDWELAARLAATEAQSCQDEAEVAAGNLNQHTGCDSVGQQLAWDMQVKQHEAAAAWERFALAAAIHAEAEASLLEMSSLGTDVPLDDNMSAALEGWQLFQKMFEFVDVPEDLDGWQQTAKNFQRWFRENMTTSGGYYVHVYADGHAYERMKWLRETFPGSKVSLKLFSMQGNEHLHHTVKERLVHLYFLMAKDKNAFDIIIQDRLLQLVEFLDTIRTQRDQRCHECDRVGHNANNRTFHPIRGDTLQFTLEGPPICIEPNGSALKVVVCRYVRGQGNDRFAVQAEVMLNQARCELVQDAEGNSIVQASLQLRDNQSLNDAALERIEYGVQHKALAVHLKASDPDQGPKQFVVTRVVRNQYTRATSKPSHST